MLDNTWYQLAAIAAGIIAWFVRLEARLTGKLDRKEHEVLCRLANEATEKRLEKIEDLMTRRDDVMIGNQEKFILFTSAMATSLHGIEVKLAVLESKANFHVAGPPPQILPNS